jgi:hypothetical protein
MSLERDVAAAFRQANRLHAFMATGEGYRLIRSAIAEPCEFVTRKREESIADWQTRAVMSALSRAIPRAYNARQS